MKRPNEHQLILFDEFHNTFILYSTVKEGAGYMHTEIGCSTPNTCYMFYVYSLAISYQCNLRKVDLSRIS